MALEVTYSYADSRGWGDLLTIYDGRSFQYDEIGNLLSDGEWMYTWSKGRQLVSMTKPGSSLTFTYDADGNRTSKTVNGVTTTYTYVDGRVTHETNGTDTIHYRYDANGTLLSMNLNGAEYYYLYNGQRDVIGLYDASGKVVVEYTYDAWGKPLTTTGSLASTVGAKNPYRYRGYRYDTESGLYALTTRYYNPQIGRFINADDAYILEDKDKEEFESNLFAYCVNNPVNRIDTLGLLSTTQKLWITAGIVTAAAIIISVASAGAATPLACTLIGASYGAIAGAAYGAASGLVTGMITGGIETRSWSGAVQGALDGAADSALSGAVTGAISGGMSNTYCFVAGTLISTATGEKAIEEIDVGDFVLSETPETEEVAYKRVLNTYVNQTSELIHVRIEGETVTATPEHPFYSPVKGWTAAVDLRPGDILVTVNGRYAIVETVEHEHLDDPIPVFNFEVEDFHTYYVSQLQILVHNACGGETPAAKYGREIHKKWDYGPGVEKEQGIKGVGRADGIDYDRHIIYELKPNNPKAIARGLKQLARYQKGMQAKGFSKWRTVLVTYDR